MQNKKRELVQAIALAVSNSRGWGEAIIDVLTGGLVSLQLLIENETQDLVLEKIKHELSIYFSQSSELLLMLQQTRSLPQQINLAVFGTNVVDFQPLLIIDDPNKKSQFVEINVDRMKFWCWESLLKMELSNSALNLAVLGYRSRRMLASVMHMTTGITNKQYMPAFLQDHDPVVRNNFVISNRSYLNSKSRLM